jgi:hypothetical protein
MKALYSCIFFCLLSLSIFAQTTYTLGGSASVTGTTPTEQCFELNQFNPHTEGAVWSTNKISLANSFTLNTRLYFGSGAYPGQADGIAFVLQRTANNIVGLDGGGLGYGGITPSFVVEFDTYQNADPFGYNNYDMAADHVGFMKNGDPSHMTGALAPAVATPFDIENGAWHNVVFSWNATTKTMTVSAFGQTYTYTGDIVATIFGNDPNVYFGLTAATGSVDNVAYQACIQNIVVVPPPPVQINCGQLRTQTPGGWGSKPSGNNPGKYLHTYFATAFPTGLTIGVNSNYTVRFTSAQAITDYLPGGGQAMKLTQNYVDPATNALKNTLVSHLVALSLSVRFDDWDATFGAGGVKLGDMIIGSGAFTGWKVRDFLAEANKVLGGAASMYTVQQVLSTATAINENYIDGTMNGGYLNCPTGGRPGIAAPFAPETVISSTNAGIRTQPNPTTGRFQLQLDELRQGNAQIEIINFNGNIIERRNLSASKGQALKFDLSNQASGIYLVRITTADGVRTQKVVVQK